METAEHFASEAIARVMRNEELKAPPPLLIRVVCMTRDTPAGNQIVLIITIARKNARASVGNSFLKIYSSFDYKAWLLVLHNLNLS